MRKGAQLWIIESIRKGRWSLLTPLLSGFFGAAIWLRHWLYDRGFLAPKYAPLPVVSIGNLVLGGVGKTQVALLLAQRLQKAAILSRGFRSRGERGKKALVVSAKHHKADECGDEPLLLASRLPQTQVVVNRDRYLSALEAKKLGAQVLILDDGMQHRRLFRDIEIVVLEGRDPFGGGHFFPRGFLREDPARLAKADAVIFVGKPAKGVEEKVAVLSEAPCIETQICVKKVLCFDGSPIASLKGKKVGLFCGIGNPDRFVRSMEEVGAVIVASYCLPDHKAIKEGELRAFAEQCQQSGAEYLLCTEKDRVKIPDFSAISELPIGWVEVELEVVKNREAWERLIKEITLLAGIKR